MNFYFGEGIHSCYWVWERRDEMTGERRDDGIPVTPELIKAFLDDLKSRGRSDSSLENYRMSLTRLYHFLPGDKLLEEHSGEEWRRWLAEDRGFSERTVNNRVSALNSFLQYLGKREWQVEKFSQKVKLVQPELTRGEYLQLLSAAKQADRERAYLLIKTMGGAGVRLQELPQLTTEALRTGEVTLVSHNGSSRRLLYLPEVLRRELVEFVRREGITSGPVFQGEDGSHMPRYTIHHLVSLTGREARVPREKTNPRCLWRMYLSTQESIRQNIDFLVWQSYNRILEEEQQIAGWAVV